MTQKKQEALAACDSGGEAILKAIWHLEATMLNRFRRQEEALKMQKATVSNLAKKMQEMRVDISVSNINLK